MTSLSSASSEMGAVLNSITLSSSETRKHPRSSSTSTRKLSQQPAGFPKILKKDEFSIRSKVGIISTHALWLSKLSNNNVLDDKSSCSHCDKSDYFRYIFISFEILFSIGWKIQKLYQQKMKSIRGRRVLPKALVILLSIAFQSA